MSRVSTFPGAHDGTMDSSDASNVYITGCTYRIYFLWMGQNSAGISKLGGCSATTAGPSALSTLTQTCTFEVQAGDTMRPPRDKKLRYNNHLQSLQPGCWYGIKSTMNRTLCLRIWLYPLYSSRWGLREQMDAGSYIPTWPGNSYAYLVSG
jgi:hypothetical protein